MGKESLKYIALNLLLALVYYVTGRLGLMLAIPPGYATVFWPASGIALAAVYRYGYRLLPGLFIGSALINILSHILGTDPALWEPYVISGLFIALGATAQAALGVALLYRTVGPSIRFERLDEIISFMFAGILASALVGATCGVTTLYLIGTLDIGDTVFSWLTWYCGDVLGMVTFAPVLVLVLNRGATMKRKVMVGLPLIIIFSAVISMFMAVRYWDDRNVRTTFESDATLIVSELESKFSGYLRELLAVQSFYAASEKVERYEFKDFVSTAFSRSPGILAIEWIQAVSQENLDTFVQAAISDGLQDFYIKKRTDSDNFVPEPHSYNEYMPIYFVEPQQQNMSVIGYDILSNGPRRTALLRARDEGAGIATDMIYLLRDADHDQEAFRIFVPVYKNDMPLNTVEQRCAAFLGAVSGVFQFMDIVEPIMEKWRVRGIEMRLYNIKDSSQEILYNSNPAAGGQQKYAYVYAQTFPVFGKNWQMEFMKPEKFTLSHVNWAI